MFREGLCFHGFELSATEFCYYLLTSVTEERLNRCLLGYCSWTTNFLMNLCNMTQAFSLNLELNALLQDLRSENPLFTSFVWKRYSFLANLFKEFTDWKLAGASTSTIRG